MKVGIFGGTFDPVHNGHLAVADEVRKSLNLTEVIFVPAGQPWLKAGRPISPAKHRMEMLHLALAGKAYFCVSVLEIERAGPSYMVDTIAELRSKLGEDDELYFIMGCDSLSDLPRWHDALRLIQMCCLVAVPRPGCSFPDLEVLEARVPGVRRRVITLDKPHIDVSASEIRERVARGLPIDHLVPEAVAGYIREHGLYRD